LSVLRCFTSTASGGIMSSSLSSSAIIRLNHLLWFSKARTLQRRPTGAGGGTQGSYVRLPSCPSPPSDAWRKIYNSHAYKIGANV
jgi:hypothetical protein